MTTKQLKSLERSLWKIRTRIEKTNGEEELKVGFGKELNDLFWKVYNAGRAQELRDLERKDKGEVCWTKFIPDDGYSSGAWIERTPHRLIRLQRYERKLSIERGLVDPYTDSTFRTVDGYDFHDESYQAARAARQASLRAKNMPRWYRPREVAA